MMTNPLRVLGVCGSLRAKSYNRALLHAAIELAPPEMVIEEYIGIGDLPHYNADLDIEGGPPSAVSWRRAVGTADALLISMPEYNFGPSGVLKNAVDWASRPPATANRSRSWAHRRACRARHARSWRSDSRSCSRNLSSCRRPKCSCRTPRPASTMTYA
jgi:NAD(P)H-dependent FMN reductase